MLLPPCVHCIQLHPLSFWRLIALNPEVWLYICPVPVSSPLQITDSDLRKRSLSRISSVWGFWSYFEASQPVCFVRAARWPVVEPTPQSSCHIFELLLATIFIFEDVSHWGMSLLVKKVRQREREREDDWKKKWHLHSPFSLFKLDQWRPEVSSPHFPPITWRPNHDRGLQIDSPGQKPQSLLWLRQSSSSF